MFVCPVLPVSGCLAVSTSSSSSTYSSSSCPIKTAAPTESAPPLVAAPPAAPTANDEDGAASSIAARRRFDANKVVITIGGERSAKDVPPLPLIAKQPLTPDWEKRLTAGRKAIEEQARLMQLPQPHSMNLTTTVVPVVPEQPSPALVIVDGRLPPVRKSNLQRSKIVQTLSIPAVDSPSTGGSAASDPHQGQPKRITALKALQRLKSTLSSPALVADPTVESIQPQRRHDLFNGGNPLLANGKSGAAIKKSLGRRLSGARVDVDPQTDGSVMSSYQPLEVDLDDDAIMV